jgi:hypothetical protein
MRLERYAFVPMFQRRASLRHNVSLRGAVIVGAGDTARSLGCVIVDLSLGGARVELDEDCELPERVHLYEADCHNVYECTVRWRQGRLVGLGFVDLVTMAARRKLISKVSQGIVESMHDLAASQDAAE